MEITTIVGQIYKCFGKLAFVREFDLNIEYPIVSGRIHLLENCFVQVYFNEHTATLSFALIRNNKRIWGLDHDNDTGWHVHTLENPDEHNTINQKSINEIAKELEIIWTLIETNKRAG